MARLQRKSALASAVLAGLATVPTQSQATLVATSVTASPGNQNVPINQGTAIAVVWSVVNSAPSGPQTATVSSSSGQFRDFCGSATSLGSVSTTLTDTRTHATTTVFTFSDSAFVPADVIYRASKLGLSSLVYERTFNENSGFGTSSDNGCVTLNIVSSSAAGFNISRLDLTFDDGAPVRVVDRRRPLRAKVDLNFSGTGLLQGVWEIADPTSTAGNPTFRPLSTVQQHLFGRDFQRLESPALPTDITGLYLVRLRITDPALGFDTPIIRYFVADENTVARLPAVPLGLVSPPNQSILVPATTFAWEPIVGARAYQLEVYEKPRVPGDTLPNLGGDAAGPPPALPPAPPVTGMLVAGTQTRTTLSTTARSHLRSGQPYLWRVLAIGKDGNVVGESPLRELQMP